MATTERTRAAEPTLTRAEAARRAEVSTATIDAEIRDGRLRATRIRRRVLIQAKDFSNWLDRCRDAKEGPRDAA